MQKKLIWPTSSVARDQELKSPGNKKTTKQKKPKHKHKKPIGMEA